MVIDWEIRQSLVSIDNLLTAKNNIGCADIDKPFDAMEKASVQNMASTIDIDIINTTKLEHLFPWHTEGGQVENTIRPTQGTFNIFFSGNIPWLIH